MALFRGEHEGQSDATKTLPKGWREVETSVGGPIDKIEDTRQQRLALNIWQQAIKAGTNDRPAQTQAETKKPNHSMRT